MDPAHAGMILKFMISLTASGGDPAHAGMILTPQQQKRKEQSGPRACGDDPGQTASVCCPKRWTPRMRG